MPSFRSLSERQRGAGKPDQVKTIKRETEHDRGGEEYNKLKADLRLVL